VVRLSACLALVCVVAIECHVAATRAADDGRRAVEVKRYGIHVRVPQAWRLIGWARDEQAFALKLPQDSPSRSGFVTCRLGVAPEGLEEYLKRLERPDVAPPGSPESTLTSDGDKRTLRENRIEPLDAARFGKPLAEALVQRLVTIWEIESPTGEHSYEIVTRVIHDGTLYTFTLATDEAHYDAYRLDFEDMLASAVFSPPETGLRKMPGGFWMQRDFRFALRLPADWKPAFGPSDKVLFFATGKTHQVFTDNLLVLASPVHPLDLEQLKATLPEQIAKADEHARVECRIVPQGGTAALETVIHTVRGSLNVAIIERRFVSRQRNYEVKFTCEASEFEKIEAALRTSLDSFVEVLDEPPRSEA
jgi:hypothetical protein